MRLDEIPPPDGLPPRVKDLLHRLDTEDGVRHLWWAIALVFVLTLFVFVGRGGSQPKDPSFPRSAGTVPVAVTPSGHTSPRWLPPPGD